VWVTRPRLWTVTSTQLVSLILCRRWRCCRSNVPSDAPADRDPQGCRHPPYSGTEMSPSLHCPQNIVGQMPAVGLILAFLMLYSRQVVLGGQGVLCRAQSWSSWSATFNTACVLSIVYQTHAPGVHGTRQDIHQPSSHHLRLRLWSAQRPNHRRRKLGSWNSWKSRAEAIGWCPVLVANRKRFAHTEFFSLWPKAAFTPLGSYGIGGRGACMRNFFCVLRTDHPWRATNPRLRTPNGGPLKERSVRRCLLVAGEPTWKGRWKKP